MARFIQKHKHEIGLSPDELIHRGMRRSEEVTMHVIDYDAEALEETALDQIKSVQKFQNRSSVTWLNINGLHDLELMAEISEVFELDKLVLAEVLNTHARPKVHEYANCVLISMKMIQVDPETGRNAVENLSLILTESVLISFQERKGDVFDPIRERIRNQKKRIRNNGTDYLVFALLDIVIDNYIFILSELGAKIEILEDSLLSETDTGIMDNINSFKRELNFLRRNIKPAKEMIIALSKLDSDMIEDNLNVHLKELKDNILQASDSSDSYRDILNDQLTIYHTTISSNLNDIMKFLTIFSVIFIPLTFIAGIYGTNFEYVPELKFKYSYFIMWGVMIAVTVGMLYYFKKRKWF